MYTNLLQISTKEDDEDEEPDEDGGDTSQDGTTSNFAWLYKINIVSEITRETYSEVWQMSTAEFFNYLAFATDKNNRERELMKKYEQQNRH